MPRKIKLCVSPLKKGKKINGRARKNTNGVKKMQNNKICDPKIPQDAQDKATLCVAVMLNGGVLNRKTAHKFGISTENYSLHSTISIIRNIRLIPVESKQLFDGTCDYYMEHEEIMRYLDPVLREQQKEEMRLLVDQKRIKRIVKHFSGLLDWLNEIPKLWRSVEHLPEKLRDIAMKLNALLTDKK